MARKIAFTFLLLVAVFLTGCDHATKAIAKSSLRGVVTIVPGVFDLQYTENRDTAFSLLRQTGVAEHPRLLALGAFAILAVVAFAWWRRRRAPLLEQTGYSMIVGGALGNVIDRLARGYVVDFMHLHAWPVFNVADMAIVFGTALVVVSTIRADRARARAV
jgi:signal peptidase II